MSVAYHGVPGAFSHEACLRFLPEEEPMGLPSFAGVIRAVEGGKVDIGMLPLENNNAGAVDEVQQLLGGSSVRIIAEHKLPVRIHLLGLPGSRIDQVRTAVSHPMAIKQCRETLRSIGLEAEEAPSTSVAAQTLRDPAKAVLASEAAAKAYGLVVLKANVHDREVNETTFVVVSR
ncbi:MAG TPA: prephenate dehydratase domain-containing protein [Sphingomicrobium sp.]|nr:prephenate dehydratase domain-containing protein [Sphingomicrobium sp.]